MISKYFLQQGQIERAVMKVCDFIDSQREKTKSWNDYSEEQLWFELVSCILGSRVRYETARACATHLWNNGFLNINCLLRNSMYFQNRIGKELSRSIYPPFSSGEGSKYRYPNSKSRYIVKTGIQIYKDNNSTIKDILIDCHDGFEARKILIKTCVGIGPKQASLFLRNISFCENLAILDSHVLRYLKLLKLNDKVHNISLEKRNYYINEDMLRLYAISKKKSLATLDVGIWVVMRLIQKEAVA
jgi:N-glycosylase/DNA lyase